MPTVEKPTILFVDDVIEEAEPLARACEGSAATLVRSFDDVDAQDLQAADLVLVDFSLESWPAKNKAAELTLRPADGLAVVEILRSHFRVSRSERPIAFGVLSGELEKLTAPFPPTRREHMVASLAKVEWAFQKGKPIDQMCRQLISLARGVKELPRNWPHDSNVRKDETLHALLAMPDLPWSSAAIGDLSRCHPPIQELSTWSHGLAFLRWMLQRILPYPTFLLDDCQAALRIGISRDSFCAAMNERAEFRGWLESALFKGILSDFRGRRWWKAGIDALLWELTVGDPFSREVISKGVLARAPAAELLKQKNPVACVDKDYEVIGVDEAKNCVRLRPDDWPLFADSAWAERNAVAADQSLLMAVEDASDRESLEAKERE
jgi:hypothetical protein